MTARASASQPRYKPPVRFGKSEERDARILKLIRSIPKGKVSTYSKVAAAAGYPTCHRLVVQLLRKAGNSLPWQRVLGAGGEIRLRGPAALEQRTRLEFEGVAFKGRKVDMTLHEHVFKPWLDPGLPSGTAKK
jgi:methylated-DNA-protein-cysteine methyltransferase-like protein